MTSKGSKPFKGKAQALVALGLGEANVHRFIKDKSKTLTRAGVRNALNLPADFERRVEFIATLIEHHAFDSIFLDWVRTDGGLEDTIDSKKAILELTSMESQHASASSSAILWRSILVSLAADPESVEIRAFLKKARKELSKEVKPLEKLEPRDDLDEALRIANGESVPAPKDPLFATFIGGVAEIVSGNRDAVEKVLGELGVGSQPIAKQYAALASALFRRSEANELHRPKGLVVRASIPSLPSGIEGQDSYQVLVRMISQPGSGHRFFDIFALIHEGTVYRLDKAAAAKLFPHRGSAIVFAAKAAGYSIPTGSEWIVTVRLIAEAHQHTAQFEVISIDRRISEVIPIPYRSSEPDKIRGAIGCSTHRVCITPVFELTDGHLLPIGNFPPNFDEPIGYLETLICYEIDGRQLVVDEIGKVDGFLDCSPADVAIRRLFKVRSDLDGIPTVTKAQVAKLADLATQDINAGLIGSGIRRAKSHVNDLLAMKEHVSLVVQELLATPSVAESLELEKQRILSEFDISQENQRQEIAVLLAKKQKVEAEIKKLREQQEAQASRLSEQLRTAFEKAAADGVKVLSNVALLSPFLRDKPAMAKESAMGTAKVLGAPAREVAAILGGIVGFSHRHGLPQSILCQAIASSIANGLIGLSGKATSLFEQAIAVTLTGTLSAKVSLSGDMFGWGDILAEPVATSLPDCPAMSLGEFVALAQRSKVPAHVSIVGANRIPPESYMAELLSVAGFRGIGSAISWRRSDGTLLSVRLIMPIFFSLTFVNGKSTFQICPPLSQMVPFINCDANWESRPTRDAGIKICATYVEMQNDTEDAKRMNLLSAEGQIAAYMKNWAVPDADAQALAMLSLRLGRTCKDDLESEAGRFQGGLGERYLAYVRHEGNEEISEIFAASGGRGK